VNRRGNVFFFGRCLLLCGKRQLLLPSFWGCSLALFALVGGFLLLCPEPKGASASIGLLFDGGNPVLAAACAPLEQEEGLPFRFYHPGEEETMRRAVLTGELHCGYLLDPGADPPVTVYETDGSFLRPVADELVFGALFEAEAPMFTRELLTQTPGGPSGFAPGKTSPLTVTVESAGSFPPPESALDLRPLLFAVFSSLFLFLAVFGGLFVPEEAAAFEMLETVRPGAAKTALLADAACTLLQGALPGLLLLAFPDLRGAASPAAFVLLAAAAAVLRQAASRLAARHPAAVSPVLLLALCWVLPAVCCSGALVDPAGLGPFASLRFLSPAWLLSRIFVQ